MPFEEKSFCQLVAQGSLSFAAISEQLSLVERENRGKIPKPMISTDTQAVIYENIPRLLPGFAGYSTPKHWITPVSQLTLGCWLLALSEFAPGACREELLKDTAILLQHMPTRGSGAIIGCTMLTLQYMMDSEGVKAILEVIKAQLVDNNVCLAPAVLCNILLGLKRRVDCAEVREILNVLCWHVIAHNKGGVRWRPEEVEEALYSLYIMPTSPEASALYVELQPQIVATKMMLEPKMLGYAFDLLNHLPDSRDMEEHSRIFMIGMQARIWDEQTLFEPSTIAHILNSLQRFPPSAEVDLFLAGMKRHLDQNRQIGQWLNIPITIYALWGLQYFSHSRNAHEVVKALQHHIAHVDLFFVPDSSDGRWLAEVIYCFQHYIQAPAGRKVAEAFLTTLADVLGLKLDITRLPLSAGGIEQILQLGRYLTSTVEGEMQLDLRSCSYFLGIALGQYVLTHRQKDISLTIILPNGSMNKAQAQTRKRFSQFLQSILAKEVYNWYPTHITLPALNKVTGKRPLSLSADHIAIAPPVQKQAKTALTELADRLRQRVRSSEKANKAAALSK